MRTLAFFLILIQCSGILFGQKKQLDFKACAVWPDLVGGGISNNGKFGIWRISNELQDEWEVQALDRKWKKEFFNIERATFTENSRQLIFINKSDSLGILNLQS